MKMKNSRNSNCSCGYVTVSDAGSPTSRILFVIERPDFEDIKAGHLLAGRTGEMLSKELPRVGLSLSSVQVTSFLNHLPNKVCPDSIHMERLVQKFTGKKKVFIMGSDITMPLFSSNALDISGIWQTSPMFPEVRFMPCISPAAVLLGDLGELRLALSRFMEK
jgi:hypothetical protein